MALACRLVFLKEALAAHVLRRHSAPTQSAIQRQLNLPEQFVLDIDLEDIVLVEKSVPNPLLQARQQAFSVKTLVLRMPHQLTVLASSAPPAPLRRRLAGQRRSWSSSRCALEALAYARQEAAPHTGRAAVVPAQVVAALSAAGDDERVRGVVRSAAARCSPSQQQCSLP